MKKIAKIVAVALVAVALLVGLSGCREADRVSHNIGKEADNFNVYRRLTVINARTDTVLMTMEGTFSLRNNNTSELEVIVEVADGQYQKHFVYLNEYTLYVVEDISGADVDKFHYEINFLPQMIGGVAITMNK